MCLLAFRIPPDIESSFSAFVVANEVDILFSLPTPPRFHLDLEGLPNNF